MQLVHRLSNGKSFVAIGSNPRRLRLVRLSASLVLVVELYSNSNGAEASSIVLYFNTHLLCQF